MFLIPIRTVVDEHGMFSAFGFCNILDKLKIGNIKGTLWIDGPFLIYILPNYDYMKDIFFQQNELSYFIRRLMV